ncbi:23S rRNA (adenine(2030)-N(6))-methyltransferase RlmJ [archaeon]|nr:23S rRNA (adenine(2030)-N(6))-methyltransferase RlmJ [archaeon]
MIHKIPSMGRYDHRAHAGNASDVWKHFLLLEAADWLLKDSARLIYLESHCGRPHYLLKAPGEWEGGIGRIWHLLPSLKAFAYFRILSELNPSSAFGPSGLLYPGSARQISELARSRGADLHAEIWDINPDVAACWQDFLSEEASLSSRLRTWICFHQADGFSGLLSHLSRASSDHSPGLLFIDPPYVEAQDVILAQRLMQKAREGGWMVLWWYMTDMMTAPADLDTLEMEFAPAGLDGGRWKGAGVAVAGPEGDQLSHLLHSLGRSMRELIRILKLDRI